MIPPPPKQILEHQSLPIQTASANFWINTFFQISTRSVACSAVYEAALVAFNPLATIALELTVLGL
jgi:hypothetical protein